MRVRGHSHYFGVVTIRRPAQTRTPALSTTGSVRRKRDSVFFRRKNVSQTRSQVFVLCSAHCQHPVIERHDPGRAGRPGFNFGNGGIATITGPTGAAYSGAIYNGKIYLAGLGGGQTVARFNSDGSVDTTFDGDGFARIVLGSSFSLDVVVQSDGKAIAVGEAYDGEGDASFSVVRFNTDGSLDTSFDGDGIVKTDIYPSGHDTARAVAVQPDGKIVVVGGVGPDPYHPAIARYNSNGSLDTSFDGEADGIVEVNIGSEAAFASEVVIQPDNKILVVGPTKNVGANSDLFVVRLNTDGSLDSSFGSGGMAIMGLNSEQIHHFHSLALQDDGKIVVAGKQKVSGIDSIIVLRYQSNGVLDSGFGSGGMVATDVGSITSDRTGIAIQTDGKILASGQGNGNGVVLRYLPNGSLDSEFGNGGIATIAGSFLNNLALQPDGDIVAIGHLCRRVDGGPS
ncbi:MAG: hypothetical protein H6650_02225 [Ardenticatenales bacterium]|nr:hypothetical protein [Ardenticatenales bacterium]